MEDPTMSIKRCGVFVVAGVVLCSAWLLLARGDAPGGSVGKTIADFSLPDADGKPVALVAGKETKATVVIFVGTECPINNLYMPRLAELHAQFAGKGVRFLAINANRHDTAKTIADHAKKHALPFPVLRDENNIIADRFGAQRTPEAVVLDAGFKIRYQGRIDDQFGIGYQRAKPPRDDLAEAIAEVLAGKKVSHPTTPVAGCKIARVTPAKQDGAVTYAKHVARILQNNCQECHRPGQIGPMPLLTYDQASAWADNIREVLEEGRMPPWYADPKHGKWANDRSLPPADRKLLLDWIAQGTPRGDDKDLPPPREFDAGWRIGKPDAVIAMTKEFEVPAQTPKGGVPYQYFSVETNFTEDKWVERAEAKAGATAVVHHIIAFVVPPGEKFHPANPRVGMLCGTAPGDMPTILAPGMARLVPKGATLVFQMHYTPNGKPAQDRSSVAIIFAKKPPTHRVESLPVFNYWFKIPPGDADFMVESSHTSKEDSQIVGFMPHMHLRGKDFLYELQHADGRKEVLLSVPRYQFSWQSSYRPAEPIAFPKGTKLHCVAHFDNSAKNFNNPDPTVAVTWGDQTWEEMMIGWTDLAYPIKKD
jgi:peroxiredoxin